MSNCLSGNFVECWAEVDTIVNLIVTTTTFIGCLYVVVIMSYWWWRLKESETNLRPLIGSIAIAKLGISLWALTNLVGLMIYGGAQQPLITLPSRILIMAAVLIQVWVTTRVQPAPHILHMDKK